MRSLREAFLDGYVSPTLAELWELGNLTRDKAGALMHSGLGLAGMGGFVSSLYFSSGIAWVLSGFLLLFATWFFFTVVRELLFTPKRERKFIRDCMELHDLFSPCLGYLNDESLWETATNLLCKEARRIVRTQNVDPSEHAISAMREHFGKQFAIAKKFQLTMEDWKPYFNPEWDRKRPS